MIRQFIVQVQDRTNTDFLKEYGTILHITKLTGVVVFEGDDAAYAALKNHEGVANIRLSDKLTLAL